MSIQSKFQKIVEDLSSLEVATFTKSSAEGATTSTTLDIPKGDDGSVSSDAVFSAIKASLAKEELVGYSRLEMEGDTIAYINNDPQYSNLVDYHKSMIEAGQQTRKNLYEAVVSLFK